MLSSRGFCLNTRHLFSRELSYPFQPFLPPLPLVPLFSTAYKIATKTQNTLYGDKSAATPGGVRLGTPAMTTRGLDETDFGESIAGFLDRVACLARALQERAGSKKLADFIREMQAEGSGVAELKADVEAFSRRFYFPGGVGDSGERVYREEEGERGSR